MPKLSPPLSVVPSLVHTPGPPANAAPGAASNAKPAITPAADTRNLCPHIWHLLKCNLDASELRPEYNLDFAHKNR
jgi:hypothetical protein